MRLELVLASSLLLAGCYQSHERVGGLPADAGPGFDASGRDAGAPPSTRTVDLLFVVDNSISMEEEQASLAANIPALVEVLGTGDFDRDGDGAGDGELGDPDFVPVNELSIAIVTSDMGSGDFNVPGCPLRAFGDDGVFRSRSDARPGCRTVYPSFLTYRAGADVDDYARDVTCVALVGNEGCGVEQPLEAMLKALSPAAPTVWTAPGYDPPTFAEGTSGHGDGANAGFIHPDGVLAVVVLSDDDDCSVRDPSLFDGRDERWRRSVNLRCVFHEVELLHPVSRYVDGLMQLRTDPRRLVFAPVIGIPVDLEPAIGEPTAWDAILADPRLSQEVDPENPTEVRPSCDEPGAGLAYPPNRIVRLGRELERQGAAVRVASICDEIYFDLVSDIVSRF